MEEKKKRNRTLVGDEPTATSRRLVLRGASVSRSECELDNRKEKITVNTFWCPSCRKPVELLLPVEPVYSLETAAMLLVCSVGALVETLRRHKAHLSPPLYRTIRRRRMRFLTATDIRTLRSILFSQMRYKLKTT